MKPKNVSSLSGDTKFIVYKSSLEQLLPSQCLLCGNHTRETDYVWRVLGTVVHIQSICNKCDCQWEWASQPFSGMMPWGNLVFAAAILFSGASPVKAINTLKFAGIQCFSYRTYFSLQQLYLVPEKKDRKNICIKIVSFKLLKMMLFTGPYSEVWILFPYEPGYIKSARCSTGPEQ